MNSADLIHCPTLFQRAARLGLKSALLTSKRKTTELLCRDTDLAIAAERPTEDWVARLGQPGDIYSREINYWLWEAAIALLVERSDLSVTYVHTTDYPMHTWAPEAPESVEHLQRLDKLIGKARSVAPDAAFFLTADHSMNFKKKAWDLTRVLADQGATCHTEPPSTRRSQAVRRVCAPVDRERPLTDDAIRHRLQSVFAEMTRYSTNSGSPGFQALS